jgi:hypothetical protein
MQSSKRFVLAVILVLALASRLVTAQGEKPAKPEPEAQPAQSEPKVTKPEPRSYLLTISVKKSNSSRPAVEKSYVLTVIADDNRYQHQSLRDGDEIPFQGEKGQAYEEVGTNLDVNDATRRGETLSVNLRAQSSSLLSATNIIPGSLPQISRWNISITAVLVPNKPTVVFSATDSISGQKVEILATAEPLPAQ